MLPFPKIPKIPYPVLALLYLLINFPTLQSYHWSGMVMYDLEYSGTAFDAEASAWGATSLVGSSKTYNCAGTEILGGYNILGCCAGNYFERIYTGLPAHNVLYFQFTMYPLDSWDGSTGGDHTSLYLDGTTVILWYLQVYDSPYTNTNICGSSFNDVKPIKVYTTVPHTSGSFTFRIISGLDQESSDESFGLRDVIMTLDNAASPATSVSYCGISVDYPLEHDICGCADNQYMYPAGTGNCYNCDSTCATCDAGGASGCTSCPTGRFLVGGYCIICDANCATCSGSPTACTSCYSGMYLSGSTCYACNSNCFTCVTTATTCTSCNSGWYMVGTTCYSTCDSPLYSYVSGAVTYCATPCPGSYVMWDGSCSSSCTYITADGTFTTTTYTEDTYLECKFPCGAGQYLYWNGSCLNNCPSPLTSLIYLGENLCGYSCASNQYLYWNGSCLNSCPSPLTAEIQGTSSQRNFCWYTCQPDQYLYWNGSCLDSCPSPLSPETEGTVDQRNFCWYTCQPNQYLYWNGSCLDSCPSPLSSETEGTTDQRNFCWYTCQPDQYLYWNGSCLSTCPSPLSSETQGTHLERNFCWYICMPWQWLYWDQTCQENCNSPLWPETQGTSAQRQYCWYPCTSESKFLYWNGTCASDCPSPLSTRYQNGQWFCDYPCSDIQYLYFNGSCLSSCPSPLYGFSEGTPSKNFCYYLCPVNEFLYWDGSCSSQCEFPLVPATQGDPVRQFCWYLCDTSEYLYWNGTCSSQCDPPLTQRTTNGRKFCDDSCNSDQYLAWNGTCLDTCPYPLSIRAEGSPIKKYFCDFPCATTEYLYWNGSCLDSCDSPLSTRTEGGRKFCDYLCVGDQYLYWNGTCKTTCDLPLVVRIDVDKRFCDYLCPANQIMYWDGSCWTSCTSPLISYSQGTPSRSYCKYPCTVTQFLYWNGTCSDSCDAPLTSSVSKGRLFCLYPCDTDQFLYFNGSCLDSCPSTLVTRVEASLNYCDYPCEDSEYLYWNGSCITTCSPPLTTTTTNGLNSCEFPCDFTSDFLYWNGTCSSECDSPLTPITQGNRNFCITNCPSEQFLYWNSSCLSSCDSPLVATTLDNTAQTCSYPCIDNSQYLYWNGSCLSQCDSPLSPRTSAGLKYCDYPCPESSSSSYLYWNASCLTNCDAPLQSRTTSDNKQYCDFPCTLTTDYLYSGGSCSSTCDSPLVSKTEGNRKFCLNVCDPSDFAYWNGSCLSTCPSPFTQKTENFNLYCNPPCYDSDGEYYYEELQACHDECKLPAYIDNKEGYLRCLIFETSTTGSSLSDMFLYAPLEANTITVVKLVKVMQYVKYLDINMPPRLQRLGISKGRNVLSFSSGIKMSSALQEQFPKEALQYVYLKNDLHSSFLVNYWEDLMNIIIVIGLACLFLILEKICRAFDWAIPEVVCQILRVVTKWNFALMVFAINTDDIILFAALEFKSLNLPASNGVSLAIAVMSICAVIVLSAITYLYVAKVTKKKLVLRGRWNYLQRSSEDFQVLFRGFRDNSTLCQLFFILYMLRIGIPMLLAVCLEVTPIGNTILQVILSLAVLTLLLKKKPFIKKINHSQLVIFESVVLLMNFSMFLLTILSMVGMSHTKGANVLGDIVIVGNDIINLMCLVFLVIKLHIESKIILAFLKKYQVSKAEALGLWLQLIFVPLQLAHMGFEEMIGYNMASHDPNNRQATFRRGHLGQPRPVYELQNEFDGSSLIPAKDNEKSSADQKRLLNNRNKSLVFQRQELENVRETRADRVETFGDKERPSSSRFFGLHSSSRSNFEFVPDSLRNVYRNDYRDISSDVIVKNFNDENTFVFSTIINPKNPFKPKSPTSIKIIDTATATSPQNDQLLLSQDSSRISLNNASQIRVKSRSSDEPLSLEKSPSDQTNKAPKGILKNSSLAQLDKSNDTINHRSQLGSASVQSFYDDLEHLVSQNPPALKSTVSQSSPTLKSSQRRPLPKQSNQEENVQNQWKNYNEHNLSPGKFAGENSNGWNKMKRHFVFGEDSADGRLRDHQPKDKSRIIDENMSFNLWKNGRKLFKPTK